VLLLIILDIFVVLLKLLILFLDYVSSVSSCLLIILIIIMNASSYLFKLPPMMLSEYHQLGSCSETIHFFLLLVVLCPVRIVVFFVIFFPIDVPSPSPLVRRGGCNWLQAVGVLGIATRVVGAMPE
jgi:hypothetical protein